jgi:hypothetical protein
MVKIGLVCWKQGGGANDYISPDKTKTWLKGLTVAKKGEFKGLIPFEKALQAGLEYKYKDVEVMFINKFDESKLKQNDVNFLVSLNLLAAWEKSDQEYNRVLKLMQKPSLNFYPNLKEQFYLFDKGDYLKYYESKGIPIAPTFVVRKDRNPKKIITMARNKGWKSLVLKPHRGYGNWGIGRFDTDSSNAEKKLQTFLTKNKKFPAFVCQEVMEGFARFWEIKSFWLHGEFKYYIAMKASGAVFSGSKIHDPLKDFGKIKPEILTKIKTMGKKIIKLFPTLNPKSKPPLYLRLDFGCCLGNTLDGSSYFLNEIEYAGCAIFTDEARKIYKVKDVLEIWIKAYYKKAKEFEKKGRSTTKRRKKDKRTNRRK